MEPTEDQYARIGSIVWRSVMGFLMVGLVLGGLIPSAEFWDAYRAGNLSSLTAWLTYGFVAAFGLCWSACAGFAFYSFAKRWRR